MTKKTRPETDLIRSALLSYAASVEVPANQGDAERRPKAEASRFSLTTFGLAVHAGEKTCKDVDALDGSPEGS